MVLSIVLIAVFLIAAMIVVADRFDLLGRLRRGWRAQLAELEDAENRRAVLEMQKEEHIYFSF